VNGTTGLRLRGKRLILTSPNPFAFTGPANFPRPKWEFNVRKVVVDVGGNASIYHSAFRIEAVPVFYFPFATHPVEGLPRPTGLLIPNVGSSSLKGTILGDSVFWSINRSMDVTAGVEYFTRRGWAPPCMMGRTQSICSPSPALLPPCTKPACRQAAAICPHGPWGGVCAAATSAANRIAVVQTTPIPIPCARMFITPLMTDCEPSGACAQIWEKIRPTSHAANAQPAPVKKPTQNQTPISWRLMVEGILDSPCGDADQEDDLNDTIIPTEPPHLRLWGSWA